MVSQVSKILEKFMKKVQVGVIGCGYWGPKLARNFHEMPETELAWVADYRPDRLAPLQESYPEVRATRDHHDILASNVDAVVIATPVSTHYSLAMESLLAGKHVLIEKPLAAKVAQATEIAETADRLGLAAMVGHTFQHNSAVNAVRDLIACGELGEVFYINATRVNLGLLQPDVNVMWDLAPHDISILMHILGLLPVQVSAQGEVYVNKRSRLHEVVYMTLHFPGGVLANVRLSWLDPVKMRRITVIGSKKMLVYDDISEDKVVLYDKGVEIPPYSVTPQEFQMSYRHGPETVIPLNWKEPLRAECESFVNWIRSGQHSCSDAWMGVQVVKVLETAQRSLLNGGGREDILP
jgi:predicted dehydrogenase